MATTGWKMTATCAFQDVFKGLTAAAWTCVLVAPLAFAQTGTTAPASEAAASAVATGAAADGVVAAVTDDVAVAVSGADRIVAGSSLSLSDRTPGDLLAAAGQLEVSAPVDGDAVLTGGEVRLNAAAARNVYAAGGRVQISGSVGRNLRAVGGQVELGSNARVDGNATLFGGDVNLRGPVKGSLRVGGGRVLIDAVVGGDVDAGAGRIELGPKARIGGALRWRSGSELVRDAGAQVAGPIERLTMPTPEAWKGRDRDGDHVRRASMSWVAGAWWTTGLMLIAALAWAAAPATSVRVTKTLRERTGWSLLTGFIALVCVPVAAVILFVTIIGAPLALVALLLYFLLLPLAYVASAAGLGQWALLHWKPEGAARTGWRIAATLLALVLLALLGSVPFVGALLAFAALLVGLGAIVLQFAPQRAAEPSGLSPA